MRRLYNVYSRKAEYYTLCEECDSRELRTEFEGCTFTLINRNPNNVRRKETCDWCGYSLRPSRLGTVENVPDVEV